ncbi:MULTISPECIES: DUF2515 family protein [Rossellomorea]|uniref:DUF2515 family protein n=1 Tax=Rossellomorea TaxID=2837508 RepID=UPI0009E2EEDD|nr:DUF2515 family protein [Rossellomorea marisflavi]
MKRIYPNIPSIGQDKPLCYWIKMIRAQVRDHNRDNISRTMAYQGFFEWHGEVRWSLLASLVSRNAGWNMTDLEGGVLGDILSKRRREDLFMTYERANWMIFEDAYPQLLIYHYSVVAGVEMFHLLDEFHVSSFMKTEWKFFWEHRDLDRLVTALIINEQNLIQGPVILDPVYRKVFTSPLFFVEDRLHFSSVIFPTLDGRLYGASVHGFRDLDNRILLGKKLYSILFHSDHFSDIFKWAVAVEPKGSRREYAEGPTGTSSPDLRSVYGEVTHHMRRKKDWSIEGRVREDWFDPVPIPSEVEIKSWFIHKEKQLMRMNSFAKWIKKALSLRSSK